ncbi:hypothetical protein FHS31_002186 [Sphingomonas vulcanisoli]|uniref:Uncharacterized protein n=1 Tax=Sphingomonas vulcanisoli TaxID=1658060 RepID=A0ABX0TW21_9SPHN|nr:hypothetical protein [Sphingomonas vulcanisoli]
MIAFNAAIERVMERIGTPFSNLATSGSPDGKQFVQKRQ